MTENFIRHLICISGTVVAILAWLAGYISGSHSWWWTAIIVAVGMYIVIYKLIDA